MVDTQKLPLLIEGKPASEQLPEIRALILTWEYHKYICFDRKEGEVVFGWYLSELGRTYKREVLNRLRVNSNV